MSNYDYRCTACGYTEEISQRMTEPAITKCPNCGKETFERIVTGGAGVLYKGEGWYVTDYSKKSSGGKDTSAKIDTPAKTETSPAKTETTTLTPKPATPEKK